MVELNQIILADYMTVMKDIPDKYFELAIVDPPYGINRSSNFGMAKFGWKQYKRSEWDSAIPDKKYFDELFRISKNQIIWGANYFSEFLPPSMGWVFWDKGQRICNSDGELAFTSFQKALRVVEYNRVELLIEGTIHPTQKPIKLYEWLLTNYAKKGQRVFDSHLGSASSAIAAHYFGVDFVGCELDKDYFEAAKARFDMATKQLAIDL